MVMTMLHAAKLFRDAMRAAMGSSIPDDFWEYSN
jgi:hypothetical protein